MLVRLGGAGSARNTHSREAICGPPESEVSMRLRTALLIASLFVMSVFAVPFATAQPSHHNPKQRSAIFRVNPQPLTWIGPTTTTTVPAPPTTTTTAPPPPTTTTTTAPPAPPVAARVATSDATSVDTADWACIRQHESGDNYSEAGGGAYQFENGTWESVTGLPGPAENYAPATQDAAALKLYSERGWEPWTTRYVCGL